MTRKCIDIYKVIITVGDVMHTQRKSKNSTWGPDKAQNKHIKELDEKRYTNRSKRI